MTITVETEADIDLNIKKLDEMLDKLKLLEDKSKILHFVTIQEFSELRGCSIKTAQEIFKIDSLPVEDIAKQKVIELRSIKGMV